MDTDKTVPVVNLPSLSFFGDPTNMERTGNIQGAWDPYILLAMVTSMSVLMEEVLSDIGMNARRAVIFYNVIVRKT